MTMKLTRALQQAHTRRTPTPFDSDHARDQLASERAADLCFGAIFALIVVGAVLKITGVL